MEPLNVIHDAPDVQLSIAGSDRNRLMKRRHIRQFNAYKDRLMVSLFCSFMHMAAYTQIAVVVTT
jgi:hypothetical protein